MAGAKRTKRTKTEAAQGKAPSPSTSLELVFDNPPPKLHILPELLKACRKGDILLVCKDNKAVQCHSQILAVTSEVLSDLFDSVDPSTTAGSAALKHVPMPEDDAEHWMVALEYLYPLTKPPRGCKRVEFLTHLALLGHKYNIPKLSLVVTPVIDHLVSQSVRSAMGGATPAYFRWVMHVKEGHAAADSKLEFHSSNFEFGEVLWGFRVEVPMATGGKKVMNPSLTGGNWLRASSAELSHFCVALVNHTSADDTHILLNRAATAPDGKTIATNATFVETKTDWDVACTPSKGYLKDGALECAVMVEKAVPTGDALSPRPQSTFYVFKWLDLAQRTHNEVLKAKCKDVIVDHAMYAVFNHQFRRDFHSWMQSLSASQLIPCLCDMANPTYVTPI